MENFKSKHYVPSTMTLFSLILLACILNFSLATTADVRNHASEVVKPSSEDNQLQTYIVYVHKRKSKAGVFVNSEDVHTWYNSFLPATPTSSNREKRMIHTYKNVVTGFAAKLSPNEVKAMQEKDGFISAHLEKRLPLHTTHTPSFLGLNQAVGLWEDSNFGKGMIIGLLDTGVFPDHPSFRDEGLPPPPAKWKGKCDFNGTVCNNKLIGARNFVSGDSGGPGDVEGHGTHTASTAGGNFVNGANALGNANGTAVGIAPLAHLAIYKVCSIEDCAEGDILAALDAAVEDGVDVLSLSLGGGSAPFFADSIAVGAFGAIQKGIFVSCSAGNEGPGFRTLSNEAPWILTVGASTIDRTIKAIGKLGDGESFDGESLFQPKDFNSTFLPLVYPGANGNISVAFCASGALENLDVKGKVVLCDRGGGIGRIDKGAEVKRAGGSAMFLVNQITDGFSTLADAHALPATHLSYSAGLRIKAYINSTSTPRATVLFEGTILGGSAPAITSFSSRGPSIESPGILKPDIVGPGVSIIAAWPFPLENGTDSKSPTFNVISGTSMSCPHLSGIAALLKSSHRDWSPAAIKSAIITTADTLNILGFPIVDQRRITADIFATGGGHVNPQKANNPGLVYDINPEDYIPYLCGLNYTDKEVGVIVQQNVSCSGVRSIPEAQLNYPSYSIVIGSVPQTFTRTVTNVGVSNSEYTVEIEAPVGVGISVRPSKILFTEVNQKATYAVRFSRVGNVTKPFGQGSLTWSSYTHSVRSPVSVIFK